MNVIIRRGAGDCSLGRGVKLEAGKYEVETEIALRHINLEDLPKRGRDGWAPGWNVDIWELTDAEASAYEAEDERRGKAKNTTRRAAEIAKLEDVVACCEEQQANGRGLWEGLPNRAELNNRLRTLNNILNEGGEGFVPHIYSKEEYERAKTRLSELRRR